MHHKRYKGRELVGVLTTVFICFNLSFLHAMNISRHVITADTVYIEKEQFDAFTHTHKNIVEGVKEGYVRAYSDRYMSDHLPHRTIGTYFEEGTRTTISYDPSGKFNVVDSVYQTGWQEDQILGYMLIIKISMQQGSNLKSEITGFAPLFEQARDEQPREPMTLFYLNKGELKEYLGEEAFTSFFNAIQDYMLYRKGLYVNARFLGAIDPSDQLFNYNEKLLKALREGGLSGHNSLEPDNVLTSEEISQKFSYNKEVLVVTNPHTPHKNPKDTVLTYFIEESDVNYRLVFNYDRHNNSPASLEGIALLFSPSDTPDYDATPVYLPIKTLSDFLGIEDLNTFQRLLFVSLKEDQADYLNRKKR